MCSLSLTSVDDEGAIAIGKLIEVSAVMETLYLQVNNIGGAGAIAIAEALKVNAVLKTLELQPNNIGDAGATAIADALKFNADLNLETLWMPRSIENHPQLLAACREKGVRLHLL